MGEQAIFAMGASQASTDLLGKYQQAKDIKAQARITSSEAEANAYILRKRAEETKYLGAKRSNKLRREAAEFAGSQAVSYAGQGVNVGTGSAAQVLGETRERSEINAIQIESDALSQAYSLRSKADSIEALAKANRRLARRKAHLTLATGGADFAGGLAKAKYAQDNSNKEKVAKYASGTNL